MSIAQNYPALKPSLLLDFANTKKLDSRVTFARASEARYYDGQTVAKAEENLLLQSQTFDNGVWVNKTGLTVTADQSTSPDGTTTAELVSLTAGNSQHYFRQLINTLSAGTYTFSFYVKAGTHNFIQVTCTSQPTSRANYDIGTGVVGEVIGSTALIANVGSGWYRCSFTFDKSTATSINFYFVSSGTAVSQEAWTAVGTETMYLWGAQLEQRSSVTAYTPTTASPVTNYTPKLLTAPAGVPRFDHDPVTGESLGLLVEEQRTNLITYSEDFSNAAWVETRSSIVSNTIVAPDGTLTGDKLVEDTSTESHFVTSAATVSSGVALTYSIFVKGDGVRNWAALLCGGTTAANNTWFDLENGVVGAVSPNATASIQDAGNGWYKCSIAVTSNSTTIFVYASIATSNSVASYTGDGYSGLYIWGAQLEAGAFPTSYIPTTSAQVTRSGDSASMMGANFSSWYRADEGTLYVQGTPRVISASPLFQVDDGTADNRILVEGGVNAHLYVKNAGSIQASIDLGATLADTQATFTAAYEVNNFAGSLNGGSVGTDPSGTLPTVDRARFGANTSDTYSCTIKKIAYYPLRLSNTNLQALTS